MNAAFNTTVCECTTQGKEQIRSGSEVSNDEGKVTASGRVGVQMEYQEYNLEPTMIRRIRNNVGRI